MQEKVKASAESVISQLVSLFERAKTQDYIGEPVSQLEHALQAGHLAQQAGAPDEVVIAALLHDIGHLDLGNSDFKNRMAEFGVADHEKIGARYLLALGFSELVADLILGHVQAKRFLVSKHPAYFKKLSPASLETLKHQGGLMSPDEMTAFERDPTSADKLRLRAWDDQAKLENFKGPPFTSYREVIFRHLARA